MSLAEVVTAVIAVIAISISIISLYNSYRTSKKMVDLEEIHAKVSKIQLQKYEAEEKEQRKANLHVELQSNGGSGKFLIQNRGPTSAKNIHFYLTENNDHNPLVGGDYENKTPFPTLNKDESYFFLASFPINISQSIYEISLRWTNPDNSQETRNYSVSR